MEIESTIRYFENMAEAECERIMNDDSIGDVQWEIEHSGAHFKRAIKALREKAERDLIDAAPTNFDRIAASKEALAEAAVVDDDAYKYYTLDGNWHWSREEAVAANLEWLEQTAEV